MDMLEAGEIDLMPNISYSAEREQKLLFSSNPEGTERYYIYARPDRDDLAKGDPRRSRPHHRLQLWRYANYRRPAVARRRRRYLHL